MFGPAFTAGLAGIQMRADWPNHVAANSENGATMSASSSNGTDLPWKAHDGNNGVHWRANTSGGGSWLQVQFDSLRRATQYSVRSTSSGLAVQTNFDLVASLDGSAWTTLDSGLVISSIGGGAQITNQPISNQTPFLFYRLSVTAATDVGSNPTGAVVGEWSFTFSPT